MTYWAVFAAKNGKRATNIIIWLGNKGNLGYNNFAMALEVGLCRHWYEDMIPMSSKCFIQFLLLMDGKVWCTVCESDTDPTLHRLYSEVLKSCGTQLSQSQGDAAFYTFKNIQFPPELQTKVIRRFPKISQSQRRILLGPSLCWKSVMTFALANQFHV